MIAKFSNWRKSRYSDPDHACIEVAQAANNVVGIRDSKGDATNILELTPGEWRNLITALKSTKP